MCVRSWHVADIVQHTDGQDQPQPMTDVAGTRCNGGRSRRGGWGCPRPPEHLDADELLEAVVAAGFGRVEGAVRVHPGAVDTAGDELARGLALLPPAADLGSIALPDLDTRAAGNVEGAIGVEGDAVGVADMLLQTD